MSDRIEFTVNGTQLSLSRSGVEDALAGVTPEPIRSHSVVVSGRAYPVKQAFATATGLDRLDFTSATARRNLDRLGFDLHRVEE